MELIVVIGYKLYRSYRLSMAETKKEVLLNSLEERKDVDSLIELLNNRSYNPRDNKLKRFLKFLIKPS